LEADWGLQAVRALAKETLAVDGSAGPSWCEPRRQAVGFAVEAAKSVATVLADAGNMQLRLVHSIDGSNAGGSILLAGVGDVDANGLGVDVVLCLADDYLDNLAVLTKVLIAAKSLEQSIFLHSRAQTSHINQVLLHDAQTSEMLARESVGLALLSFLLGGGGLLLLLSSLFGSPEGFPGMGVSDEQEEQLDRDVYSSGPGLRNSMLASSSNSSTQRGHVSSSSSSMN
ncbi:hypothetical protein KCV03_g107, partial [Aureobasidium melanogenum]